MPSQPMRKHLGRIAIGIALVGSTALAQSIDADALKNCRKIGIDSERLKCFETLVDSLTEKKIDAGMGNWRIDIEDSKLDRSKNVFARLISSETKIYKQTFGERNDSILFIACRDKKTHLFLSFDTMVSGGKVSIDYRVGNLSPRKAKWERAQNYRGYGPWDSKDTIPLIKELIEADDFFVRGESDIGGTTESLFKLNGIKAAIKPVREACKW